MTDLKSDLSGLSDYAFQRLRRRLDGTTVPGADDQHRVVRVDPLTDEEYLWEPVADCWNLRATGDGTFRADRGLILDEDPPFTTIAWRIAHIIEFLAAERCATWLGLQPEPPVCPEGLPGTAREALDALDRAYATWGRYLDAQSEDGLRTVLGPIAGQYAEGDRAGFVLHIIDELIHHAAEVALLRDLYRASRPQDPFVAACLRAQRDVVDKMVADDAAVLQRTVAAHPELMVRAAATGRWEALPLLADLGFPINGTGGRTPLHHAAAEGDVDLVRDLLQRGADVDARDPLFNETALGWARHFRRLAVVGFLEERTRA